jgi:DNA-binding transcriptional LysR family regulator
MDLRHLRTFVVVAEERSFTKAAARLHISQPPLSRHIQQLEEMLGVQLLARNRQKVEPTAEGKVLLVKAKAAVTAAEDVLQAAEQLRAGAIGSVKMGLSWGLWDVALAIRSRYAARCPHVILEVADTCSSGQADALIAQNIDIGLMRGESTHPALLCAPLFDERLVVMLPSTHPLANADSVKLSDLSTEAVAVSQSTLHDRVLEMYSRAGVTPAGMIGCPGDLDMDATRMLVASGRAIYFWLESSWTTSAQVAGISTVRVDEPGACLSMHVSWRKSERSASVLTLVDCARKTFMEAAHAVAPRPFARREPRAIEKGVHLADVPDIAAPGRSAIFSPSSGRAMNRRRLSTV